MPRGGSSTFINTLTGGRMHASLAQNIFAVTKVTSAEYPARKAFVREVAVLLQLAEAEHYSDDQVCLVARRIWDEHKPATREPETMRAERIREKFPNLSEGDSTLPLDTELTHVGLDALIDMWAIGMRSDQCQLALSRRDASNADTVNALRSHTNDDGSLRSISLRFSIMMSLMDWPPISLPEPSPKRIEINPVPIAGEHLIGRPEIGHSVPKPSSGMNKRQNSEGKDFHGVRTACDSIASYASTEEVQLQGRPALFLRWLAVLPMAMIGVVASQLGFMAVIAIAGLRGDFGSMSELQAILFRMWADLMSGLIAGAAFVVSGQWMAPSRKSRVAIMLAATASALFFAMTGTLLIFRSVPSLVVEFGGLIQLLYWAVGSAGAAIFVLRKPNHARFDKA